MRFTLNVVPSPSQSSLILTIIVSFWFINLLLYYFVLVVLLPQPHPDVQGFFSVCWARGQKRGYS